MFLSYNISECSNSSLICSMMAFTQPFHSHVIQAVGRYPQIFSWSSVALTTSLHPSNLQLGKIILKMSSRGLTWMLWNDSLHVEQRVVLARQSGQVQCPFTHTATGACKKFKQIGQLIASVIFRNTSLNSVKVRFSCNQEILLNSNHTQYKTTKFILVKSFTWDIFNVINKFMSDLLFRFFDSCLSKFKRLFSSTLR